MPDALDPTLPPDPAFDRRTFVGLSAGAAAFGAAIGRALAAGAGFGAPHPPIVAEDDAAIAVSRPQLSSGGRAMGAYMAAPRTPTGRAVVVVQAIWGVDAQLRDTVRRLAKAGYAAIAPDLYAGLDAPSGDGATDYKPYHAIADRLADAGVDADLAAAAAYLRSQAGGAPLKVGVTGFCMGGAITLRQTVDGAAAFDAAAVFYGKVRYSTSDNGVGPVAPIALAYADEIAVPVIGSWGKRDTSILADDVSALDGRLAKLGKPHDFKVYPEAGHAFFDDTRPSYVASAAADAWTRTLAWFGTHLG